MDKANALDAMDRLLALYRREMPDRILATISVPSPRTQKIVTERNLDTVHARPRPPIADDLDLLFDLVEAGIADRSEVEDDSIPAVNPNSQYGDYIFGGLLGAPMSFYGTDVHTWSWTQPLIADWSQVEELTYDPHGRWTEKCLENLWYGVQRSEGRYGMTCLLAIEALNLCVMLVGAQRAYTDIYDHPGEMRKLMAFGVELIEEFAELQRGVVREHNERTFDHPQFAAESLHHSGLSMSVDAYDLCRVEVYQEMGREFQADLIQRCGRAAYHIHGDGRHLIPEVAGLPNIIGMNIQDDMHEILPRAFVMRQEFRELTGDTPLQFTCGRREFVAALKESSLPGGVIYGLSADSTQQANEIMEQVRGYRAPEGLCARALAQ